MTYQQLFKVSEAATLIAEATGGDKFDVARRISNDTRLTNFQFYDTEGRAFQCSQVLYGITSDIPGKGPLKFSDAQCFFHRMDINQLLNFLGYHPSIQEKILNARPLVAAAESATCQAIREPQQGSEPAPMLASASSAPVKARRDLLTPVIEAAQKDCGNPFDVPAVWATLVHMAGAGKLPLLGFSDEGIKWQDSNDGTQFFTIKSLRGRLSRSRNRAL